MLRKFLLGELDRSGPANAEKARKAVEMIASRTMLLAAVGLFWSAAQAVLAQDPDATRMAYQAFGFASEAEYRQALSELQADDDGPLDAIQQAGCEDGLGSAATQADETLWEEAEPTCAAPEATCGMADVLSAPCNISECGDSLCGSNDCSQSFLPGCCLPCGGCLSPFAQHRHQGFGDFLYLRPRNAEVAYADPIDGPIQGPPANNPIQIGRVGVADPDFSPGFRVGYNRALSDCSSARVTYTFFQSNTNDAIATTAPNVIRSIVSHPSSASASSDFLRAIAGYGVDFQLADAEYRRLVHSGCNHGINLVVGARYGYLNQDFISTFFANGTERVISDLEFDGAGPRVGLDFQSGIGQKGMLLYGSAASSFLAGEFRGQYLQQSSFDPVVVDGNWKSGRILTTLDLELGAGWQSANGHIRLSAGYLVSAWFNAVKTSEFIHGIQQNDFRGLSDTISFDGLIARAEVRW